MTVEAKPVAWTSKSEVRRMKKAGGVSGLFQLASNEARDQHKDCVVPLYEESHYLSALSEAAALREEIERLREQLASEEARNEALCKRLDAERSGEAIAHCYDPEDWEYTYAWEDRDEVHGHGENLERGKPMLVFTLLRGPRKWVAEVPVTFDVDGEPDETEFRWFDSEEAARAALGSTS